MLNKICKIKLLSHNSSKQIFEYTFLKCVLWKYRNITLCT
jgi:hypothetical protein